MFSAMPSRSSQRRLGVAQLCAQPPSSLPEGQGDCNVGWVHIPNGFGIATFPSPTPWRCPHVTSETGGFFTPSFPHRALARVAARTFRVGRRYSSRLGLAADAKVPHAALLA